MKKTGIGIFILSALFSFNPLHISAQEAYFVDGFHGGIWGHYPEGYTKYITGLTEKHPEWRVNLEIEPETWEREKRLDPVAFNKLKAMFSGGSAVAKAEYVNPAFGQSYFFTTNGESIIRQFYYGMKMLRTYFPDAQFKTYSSEEPCFTSALPQILTSFGFKYASLKNPNTCWGGYTRAHGGELVYWTGSDGSKILTVPRYEIEALKPNSTWETIASGNSPEYINAAFNYGIKSPVGMCLQDAGWKWGPWLKGEQYKPSIYTTWTNYFENIVDKNTKAPEWKLNQEDVQVSLVWGSQVLQRLAQQVRVAENNLVQAEKVLVINDVVSGVEYPSANIDEAWRQLMLAQHHDCWIVPYNGGKGNSWADKVVDWTGYANTVSNKAIAENAAENPAYIKVYNTSGYTRTDYVRVPVSADYIGRDVSLSDDAGTIYAATTVIQNGKNYLVFRAEVAALGFKTFKIENKKAKAKQQINVTQKNSISTIETPYYKIIFDAAKGGAVTSLVAKQVDDKEFVDKNNAMLFGSLRGNFYNDGGMKSTDAETAVIKVLSQSADLIQLQITTNILGNAVAKTVTLYNDNPRIDFNLKIDWKNNIGIGSPEDKTGKEGALYKKFYNDSNKLITPFPVSLKGQRVYKNSAFDVMESGLDNTFFDTWDNIKNNIIVNWVDVTDADGKYGFALFSDHTTTYTHGKDYPLGLTLQYSGRGLWGQGYSIDGASEINYSILPHKGDWKKAGIWNKNREWEEPLRAEALAVKPVTEIASLLSISNKGWDLVSAEERDGAYYIRIFNAEGSASGKVVFTTAPTAAELVSLAGETEQKLSVKKKGQVFETELTIPQFAFKTIKLSKKQ